MGGDWVVWMVVTLGGGAAVCGFRRGVLFIFGYH